jgi:hypothetical protein
MVGDEFLRNQKPPVIVHDTVKSKLFSIGDGYYGKKFMRNENVVNNILNRYESSYEREHGSRKNNSSFNNSLMNNLEYDEGLWSNSDEESVEANDPFPIPAVLLDLIKRSTEEKRIKDTSFERVKEEEKRPIKSPMKKSLNSELKDLDSPVRKIKSSSRRPLSAPKYIRNKLSNENANNKNILSERKHGDASQPSSDLINIAFISSKVRLIFYSSH